MATAAAQKFLFDRSFDAPKPEPEAEVLPEEEAPKAPSILEEMRQEAPPQPPEPEVEFTKAQLDAAREEGYIEGHTAALDDAETSREHYVADAINLLGKGVDTLEEQQKLANEELARTSLRMLFAVFQKVLPATSQKLIPEEIETLVQTVIAQIYSEPRLVVRVHPMIAEDVERRVVPAVESSKFEGVINVISDSELQPGDCRLEWDGGGAERSEARIWRDLEDVISHTIGHVDLTALEDSAGTLKPADAEKLVPGLHHSADDSAAHEAQDESEEVAAPADLEQEDQQSTNETEEPSGAPDA